MVDIVTKAVIWPMAKSRRTSLCFQWPSSWAKTPSICSGVCSLIKVSNKTTGQALDTLVICSMLRALDGDTLCLVRKGRPVKYALECALRLLPSTR